MQDVKNVARGVRNVVAPPAEPAVGIDSLHPLVECRPLYLVARRFLTLHFKHQDATVLKADQKVRPVFRDAAGVDVADFKAEMIVLRPRCDDV